jgi:ribosome biogenesis protein NSA2
MHEKRNTKQKDDEKTPQGAVPAYLLDREGQSRAKVLSNMIKQKRKEKAVSNFFTREISKFEGHDLPPV